MSQVTDPIMLDTTGQDIVAKLQDVIDAINGGTIDPLTVTQNGTYTPSGTTLGYGPVTVNVQGGGGGGLTILSGTGDPSASQGDNGQLYLKYGSVPSGYAQLEYLEVQADGPYIDTGVVNNSTAYFELDAQYTSAPGNNYGLFGSMGPSKEFVINAYGGEVYLEAGASRGVFTSSSTVRHTFAGKADGLYLDGELLSSSVNWGNSNGLTYYLFAFHYYTGVGIYKTANARIYGCKLYNGNVLVRNFMPVMRLSDSALGMLDIVNTTFYPNEGSGTFIAGPSVSDNSVSQAFVKVNGAWQNLIGTDINDVNLGS